jgi:hypothetical protein
MNPNNTYKRERRLGLIGNGIIIKGCSEGIVKVQEETAGIETRTKLQIVIQ